MNTPIHFVNPVEGMDIVPDGWEGQDYKMVMASDFDRVTAERDALQLRLNAVEEENDRLRSALRTIRNHTSVSGNQIDMIDEALEKRP